MQNLDLCGPSVDVFVCGCVCVWGGGGGVVGLMGRWRVSNLMIVGVCFLLFFYLLNIKRFRLFVVTNYTSCYIRIPPPKYAFQIYKI